MSAPSDVQGGEAAKLVPGPLPANQTGSTPSSTPVSGGSATVREEAAGSSSSSARAADAGSRINTDHASGAQKCIEQAPGPVPPTIAEHRRAIWRRRIEEEERRPQQQQPVEVVVKRRSASCGASRKNDLVPFEERRFNTRKERLEAAVREARAAHNPEFREANERVYLLTQLARGATGQDRWTNFVARQHEIRENAWVDEFFAGANLNERFFEWEDRLDVVPPQQQPAPIAEPEVPQPPQPAPIPEPLPQPEDHLQQQQHEEVPEPIPEPDFDMEVDEPVMEPEQQPPQLPEPIPQPEEDSDMEVEAEPQPEPRPMPSPQQQQQPPQSPRRKRRHVAEPEPEAPRRRSPRLAAAPSPTPSREASPEAPALDIDGTDLPDAPPTIKDMKEVIVGQQLKAAGQKIVEGDNFKASLYTSGIVALQVDNMDMGDAEFPSAFKSAQLRGEYALVYNDPSDPIKDIAAGANHLVMRSKKGFVYTFGRASEGQLGSTRRCNVFRQNQMKPVNMRRTVNQLILVDGEQKLAHVVFKEIDASGNTTTAIAEDGTIFKCGEGFEPRLTPIGPRH